jgi:hypothetical protein
MKTILKLMLAGILVVACSREPQQTAAQKTEMSPQPTAEQEVFLLYNAVIYTVDEAQPSAGAMAYDGEGRILAVGTTADLMAEFPEAPQRNMEGRTVIPGLIDSHAHLHGLAVSLSQAQLAGTASKEEVIQRLKEHEASLSADDWLLGRGWDQNDWPVKEFPTSRDLDEPWVEAGSRTVDSCTGTIMARPPACLSMARWGLSNPWCRHCPSNYWSNHWTRPHVKWSAWASLECTIPAWTVRSWSAIRAGSKPGNSRCGCTQ